MSNQPKSEGLSQYLTEVFPSIPPEKLEDFIQILEASNQHYGGLDPEVASLTPLTPRLRLAWSIGRLVTDEEWVAFCCFDRERTPEEQQALDRFIQGVQRNGLTPEEELVLAQIALGV